jgi:hypothetical protein
LKLSRRTLICGLLASLALFGVKNKKKKYIKFKKPDNYPCVNSKTTYKCSPNIIYDYEYELVDSNILSTAISTQYSSDEDDKVFSDGGELIGLKFRVRYIIDSEYMFTVIYNGTQTYITTNKENFEIVEK